jgi:hypothetical protein
MSESSVECEMNIMKRTAYDSLLEWLKREPTEIELEEITNLFDDEPEYLLEKHQYGE